MDVDFLFTAENGTDGAALTPTILQAGHTGVGTWTVSTNPTTYGKIVTRTDKRLRAPVTIGGYSVWPSGTRALAFRHDQEETARLAISGANSVSIGFLWTPTFNAAGFAWYDEVVMFSALDYLTISLQETGIGAIVKTETSSGLSASSITGITDGQTYYGTLQFNALGTGYVAIYETDTWTQVGSTISKNIPNAGACTSISFGDNHTPTGPTSGYCYFDNIIGDQTDATFPLLPPSPADVLTLNQTANSNPVTELWKRGTAPSGTPEYYRRTHSGPYPTQPEQGYIYTKHGADSRHVYIIDGTVSEAAAIAASNS